MPLTTRPARPADATQMTELLNDIIAIGGTTAHEEPFDPDGMLHVYIIPERHISTFVAELDGAIVGFASLHETPVPHRPTAVGRITAIAVLPDTRGTGAGRALVKAAEAYFVAKGIARLEVTSGENHAAAHPFYRHLGYMDQGIRFAKELK